MFRNLADVSDHVTWSRRLPSCLRYGEPKIAQFCDHRYIGLDALFFCKIVARCVEKTFMTVCSAFQNLRLGGVNFQQKDGTRMGAGPLRACHLECSNRIRTCVHTIQRQMTCYHTFASLRRNWVHDMDELVHTRRTALYVPGVCNSSPFLDNH